MAVRYAFRSFSGAAHKIGTPGNFCMAISSIGWASPYIDFLYIIYGKIANQFGGGARSPLLQR